MQNEPKGLYATQEEVKIGILELFSEQEEFKGQSEIVKALLAKGIHTKQVMVSRVLKDPAFVRRHVSIGRFVAGIS